MSDDSRGCVFCGIVAGAIPSNKAYEDEEILAFYDINPQAPVHILIIPKAHIEEIADGDSALAGKCLAVAATLARELKLAQGFRIVANHGPAAGQTVPHLHFHLLAGRQLELTMG